MQERKGASFWRLLHQLLLRSEPCRSGQRGDSESVFGVCSKWGLIVSPVSLELQYLFNLIPWGFKSYKLALASAMKKNRWSLGVSLTQASVGLFPHLHPLTESSNDFLWWLYSQMNGPASVFYCSLSFCFFNIPDRHISPLGPPHTFLSIPVILSLRRWCLYVQFPTFHSWASLWLEWIQM